MPLRRFFEPSDSGATVSLWESSLTEHQIRTEILVRGKVQKVNFRDLIEEVARAHHLTGKVENLKTPDKSVLIICEGSQDDVKQFIDDLKKSVPPFE